MTARFALAVEKLWYIGGLIVVWGRVSRPHNFRVKIVAEAEIIFLNANECVFTHARKSSRALLNLRFAGKLRFSNLDPCKEIKIEIECDRRIYSEQWQKLNFLSVPALSALKFKSLLSVCLRHPSDTDFSQIITPTITIKSPKTFVPYSIYDAARCRSGIVVSGWLRNFEQRRVSIASADLSSVVSYSDILVRAKTDRDGPTPVSDEKGGFLFVLERRTTFTSYYFVEHFSRTNSSVFFGPFQVPATEEIERGIRLAIQPFGHIQGTPSMWARKLYTPLLNRTGPGAKKTEVRNYSPFRLPRPDAPLYSIIIPFYRDDFFLRGIFELHHQLDSRFEVILVVNNPMLWPKVILEFEKRYRFFTLRTTVVRTLEAYGSATANNLGVLHSGGRVLFFMNPEVWIGNRNALLEAGEQIRAELEKGQHVVTGFSLLYEDETIEHLGMEFRVEGSEHLFYVTRPMKGLPRGLYDGPNVRTPSALTGALLAMSIQLYRRLGGFDETYRGGEFEHADICLRAREAGADILLRIVPNLYHLENQSIEDEPSQQLATLLNCIQFNQKWQKQLKRPRKIQRNS